LRQDDRTRRLGGSRGQALLELALVVPVLLLLVGMTVLSGRVLQARAGIAAAGREAGRVYAESTGAGPGFTRAVTRAREVASGYRLQSGRFDVAIGDSGFARGGVVTVRTAYAVPVGDIPLASVFAGGSSVTVRYEHRERIELYRSRD
jgi:hypothetical protein